MRFVYIFLLAITAFATTTAATTLNVDTVTELTLLPQLSFGNPALRLNYNQASQSTLSVSFTSSPAAKQAKIAQFGTGGRDISADATTFQKLSDIDRVWGKAGYANGRVYDVTWRETSDFNSLYPYTLGDPRGGDLKHEQYFLSGGYARRFESWSLGIDLGYRALSEYRDRDPRPNNTTADLHADIAVARNLSSVGNKSITLSLNAGKYKQTSDLVYLNELGAQKEYLMTGIGNDFSRFSGATNSCFYKGYNTTVGIGYLTDINNYRVSATVKGDYSTRERILSDLNRLPLNRLKCYNLLGEASFNRSEYALIVNGYFKLRQGNDNLFGEATGNIYPQIGTRRQYVGHEALLSLEGNYIISCADKLQVSVNPLLSFSSFHSHHNDSGNRLNTDDLTFGSACDANIFTTKHRESNRPDKLRFAAKLYRRANISNILTLNTVAVEELNQVYNNINTYFAKGETSACFSFAYDYHFSSTRYLTVAADWRHDTYLDGIHANTYGCSVAFTL